MRRVDVVDPGADGTRIGNALRDEGLSVDQRTLESLVKRYPLAGEAQLARERLGTTSRR